MPKQRYVRKDRRIYDFSTCRLCGTAYGVVKPEVECKASICKLCGTKQCLVNGLGHGTCSVCLYGLLPGWSGNETKCRYKGCNKEAVARGKHGKTFVCLDHAVYLYPNILENSKQQLEKNWELVEENPNSPY